MNPYPTSASSYLERARRELASGEAARLFYSALELRAGIEARLQEYLEHHEHVPDGKKRDWKIAQLGASVSKAFQIEQVARIQIRDRESKQVQATLFYTPVSNELRKLGERLGDYLHARPYRPPGDPWWSSFRTKVEVGCHLLEEATYGQLLGPPLINSRTGMTHMPMELSPGEKPEDFVRIGASVILDIRYFDSLADARGDAA